MTVILPCWPCPHASACCSFGVDLLPLEAINIIAAHGEDTVVELRTAVVDGHCVFLDDNKCSIHNETYYPSVCRAYPLDAEHGGEYEGEHVCPEMQA